MAEPTPRDHQIILESLREFSQMQTVKGTLNAHCEEVAQLILPTSRNTFYYGSSNTQGEKKTDRQVDATGMMALHRFAAIVDSLLTPRNGEWHTLAANNKEVMKDRRTKLWFEEVNRILFEYRYAPLANFSSQNQNCFQSLGAFGNSAMFIDELDAHTGIRGNRYKGVPFGEVYFRENHQGIVDGFIRAFRLTAYQAKQKWPTTFPQQLQTALESNSETKYDFLHRVCPRDNYDSESMASKDMPFASYYISMTGPCLLDESGYGTFPMAISRYDQTPGETYGRGPAMLVLPSLKTLNAEKAVFLTQGHRAAAPVLLIGDDGLMDMSLRPGAMNKGGVNADGKPMVHVLPSGDIQISKEMMAEEKSLINDAFLVTLFQILTETPQMTATEVIERVNEKGILLAPTVGRQQSEYIAPMIDREIDLLSRQRLLPPMPQALREAEGHYKIVHTSPLARAMRAQEASGYWRTVSQASEVAKITGDPSVLDPFNFTIGIQQTAEINGVKPSWMEDEDGIAAKRENRSKAQQAQQQIQAAPAAAAMMKAKVAAAEAGVTPEQMNGA